jgi:ATP-dependent DNA ligase
MTLPIRTSYEPMEARPAEELPQGKEWQYEPKWDGFRCLAFRDRERVDLFSKAGKPLTRYFPDLVVALASLSAKQFVLDGEIVIPLDGTLSFDSLLMRIHPAASRIQKLSQSTPCLFIVFDLLVHHRNEYRNKNNDRNDEQAESLVKLPLRSRRQQLERFAKQQFKANRTIHLSPVTNDLAVAQGWFDTGSGLDGVVAKRRDLPYMSGERAGMQKIKSRRTADCVVGGFRYLEKEALVGSLLLGLYNDEGKLDHVGFTSSIHRADRPALTKKLERLIQGPGFDGRAPGGPSRWSTRRSAEWQPLAPRLVVEVQFDHFTGGRFRHGTKFLRWRPDKATGDCTLKQVERESRATLDLFHLAT